MTLRRLNILLVSIAIALGANAYFSGPDNAFSTCMNWNKAADTLAACTKLIDSPDTKAEDLPVLLSKRAWAARRMGDFEAAMVDIDGALELQPNGPLIWVNRAFVNDAQDNWAAADEDFERALALAPENLFTIMDRATILTRRGDNSGALRDYLRALEIDPNSKRAMNGIIQSYKNLKQYERALEWLNQAMQQWPKDANYAREVGVIQYANLEDYQAALESFEAAAVLDPTYQVNLFFLGATNFKLGRIELGKSYIERHAEQMAQSLKNDGGLFQHAMMVFADATQIVGNSEFFFRGVSYAMAEQPEFARIEFDSYLESGGSNAMLIMRSLLATYGACNPPDCELSEKENYNQALTQYLEAAGRVFALENH